MRDDIYHRLMAHFLIVARDALDDDASVDEVVFEARVLYGRFLGWHGAASATVH